MDAVAVPCGRCTACCRYELIPLTDGDDVTAYETEIVQGVRALKRRADGSCVYLGKRGCRIHDRAPAVCRVFDCRRFALRAMAGAYEGRLARDEAVVSAGLERLHTLPPRRGPAQPVEIMRRKPSYPRYPQGARGGR